MTKGNICLLPENKWFYKNKLQVSIVCINLSLICVLNKLYKKTNYEFLLNCLKVNNKMNVSAIATPIKDIGEENLKLYKKIKQLVSKKVFVGTYAERRYVESFQVYRCV